MYILLSIGKSIDEMLFNKTLDLIDSHRLEIGVKWAHTTHTLLVSVKNLSCQVVLKITLHYTLTTAQQKPSLIYVLIGVLYSFFVSEIIYADSAGVRYVQYFVSR